MLQRSSCECRSRYFCEPRRAVNSRPQRHVGRCAKIAIVRKSSRARITRAHPGTCNYRGVGVITFIYRVMHIYVCDAFVCLCTTMITTDASRVIVASARHRTHLIERSAREIRDASIMSARFQRANFITRERYNRTESKLIKKKKII